MLSSGNNRTMLYPEIGEWFLMGPFLNPLVLSIGYYLLCYFLETRGQNGWDNEQEIIMKIYVVVLAIANWILVISFINYTIDLEYSYLCEAPSKFKVHPSEQPRSWFSWLGIWDGKDEDNEKVVEMEIRVAKLIWWYMITKLWEFIDQALLLFTNRVATQTNIIHHMVMASLAWLGLRYLHGGSTVLMIIINCGFLAIAYTSQTIKRFFPHLINWAPVKSVIYDLKIIHYLVTVFHCLCIIFAKKCEYPPLVALIIFIFVVILLYLSVPPAGNPPAGGGSGPAANNGNAGHSINGGGDDSSTERDANVVPENPENQHQTNNNNSQDNTINNNDGTNNDGNDNANNNGTSS